MESDIEEDIDLKNQVKITGSPNPLSIREAASINIVGNEVNDPIKIKNTAHVDFEI